MTINQFCGVQVKSEAKIKYLLGLGPKPEGIPILEKYGLGRARSIKSYWQWAGIDPNNRNKTTSDPKFCNRS